MTHFFTAAKKQVQRLPWPLFFPIYRVWYSIHDDLLAERVRWREGVPSLADLDLARVKRSDTVFILGSGPSINAITPDRWEIIRANDTIALNHWLIHPFVPNFYCFESLPYEKARKGAYDLLLKNMRSRAADYAETIKVVNDLNRGVSHQLIQDVPPEWKKNLYFAGTPPVVARTEVEFKAATRHYLSRGLFSQTPRIRSLFKYNSNLVTCVSLAIRMGYRCIVLCGVDLYSQDYFYHDPHLFPETVSISVGGPREQVNDQVIPLSWLVPLDKVLVAIRHEVLQPRGVELFVESSRSLLYPRIPQAPESLFANGGAAA